MRWLHAAAVAVLIAGCARDAPPEVSRASEGEHAQLHFAGDVYFGEAYRSALSGASTTKRYEEALSRLEPALKTAPIVANLETALTEARKSAFEHNKDYLHWSPPEHTLSALARHGFVGLSLSNNHAMDYGLPALEETRRSLVARGLTPFGAGATDAEAREPYELDLRVQDHTIPVTVIGTYWYRPKYETLYRFYASPERGGVRELALADITGQIASIKEREPSRMVVVFPHWGRNYKWRNKHQKRLAHALVDAGADLVIGHGAHVYQEVERYRDSWILYGLGNLVFLTPGRYAENDAPPYSMMATVRWSPEQEGMRRELVLRFIASDNLRTDYQPHLVTGGDFDDALERLSRRSCRDLSAFCSSMMSEQDELGPYVRLPL